MSGLEVAGDLTGMWQESVQNVATGLAGLGTEELAANTQRLADALDVLGGTAQIIAAAASLLTLRNAKETVQLAGEVAAKAANPLTWPMIALGVTAAAATGAVVYAMVREQHTVRADLGTASGALGMATTVGALA